MIEREWRSLRSQELSERQKRNLQILKVLRKGGSTTKADITKITDLNIVTISHYISQYVKEGVVIEKGLDDSAGGRRPMLIELSSDYGYAVGIDLGPIHITQEAYMIGVITDLKSRVIAHVKVKKTKEDFQQMDRRVADIIKQLMAEAKVKKEDIRGVGLGAAGVIDTAQGIIRNPATGEVTLKISEVVNELHEKFNTSVLIEHDAIAGALGELWEGHGKQDQHENIIFVCSDSGCGLVMRGEVYYGANRSVGELNLNPADPNAAEDPYHHCWEVQEAGCALRSRGIDLGISQRAREILSEKKTPTKILELAGGKSEDVSLTHVVNAASHGDALALKLVHEAGGYLGVKIAYLINVLNPSLVVMGRGIEVLGDQFLDAVDRSVRRWAFEEPLSAVKIVPSALGEDAIAIGSADLILQNIFIHI